MTTDVARRVLFAEAHLRDDGRDNLPAVHAEARKLSHPDRKHGDDGAWHAVEQAAEVLKRAGML